MKPPVNLITPIKVVDGQSKQLNISGLYRPCEEIGCETYITCPYVRCFEHWYALISKDNVTMKEWK